MILSVRSCLGSFKKKQSSIIFGKKKFVYELEYEKQLLSLFSMKILHTNVGCKSFQSTLHVVNGCLKGNPKHLKFGLINNMFLEQILKKKKIVFFQKFIK